MIAKGIVLAEFTQDGGPMRGFCVLRTAPFAVARRGLTSIRLAPFDDGENENVELAPSDQRKTLSALECHQKAPASLGANNAIWRQHRPCVKLSSVAKPVIDISKMTPDERLSLIGKLRDSLDDLPPVLSDEQSRELARRVERVREGGASGTTISEIRERLFQS
jgi:putative addiction module component (TIGR02574 family)